MTTQPKLIKILQAWMIFRNGFTITKLSLEYLNQNYIQANTALWGHQQGISADQNSRIKKNALKYYLVKNQNSGVIDINRFTRFVFGLTQLSITLEGKLKGYSIMYKHWYEAVVETISNNMYIDELVSWRSILSEVERLKQQSIELFSKRGFILYK